MSAVTVLLRLLLSLIFSDNKKVPRIISYLGTVLPYAIIGMLVVFCLKDTSFSSAADFLPQLIAGSLAAASYAWKKNTLASIIIRTASYMLLVQFVFV